MSNPWPIRRGIDSISYLGLRISSVSAAVERRDDEVGVKDLLFEDGANASAVTVR